MLLINIKLDMIANYGQITNGRSTHLNLCGNREGAFNLWANKPKTTPRPPHSCVQNWRNYEQG